MIANLDLLEALIRGRRGAAQCGEDLTQKVVKLEITAWELEALIRALCREIGRIP